jgi:3-deoxy-D-manno-octulosonate cytidylyltransferase
MDVICVIPARLASTRFPRKMVAPLGGKPLIQWTYEAAKRISCFREVVIAVDTEELQELAQNFGARALMTSTTCQSGTERLIELVERNELEADVLVNWQGDEPFVSPEMIEDLLQTAGEDGYSIWTLSKEMEEEESPHLVKIVSNHAGEALYFSRSPIPYFRNAMKKSYWKHIGIYAYTPEALRKISSLPHSYLEEAEQLEQLRFLQGGLKIRVHKTRQEFWGIDIPEDLERAKLLLRL